MGCIYTGMKNSRRVNGFFKVGMTQDSTPTKRWNAYDLMGLMYVYCPKATKTELLYLEAVARLRAERIGMTLQGNDCFLYAIEQGNKSGQAIAIARAITEEVCQHCEKLGIEYEWRQTVFCR